MEGYSSLLTQLSHFKRELDGINRELEEEIRRTGTLDFEHSHLREIEKEATADRADSICTLVRKDGPLNDLSARLQAMKEQNQLAETRVSAKETRKGDIRSKIDQDRDAFVAGCKTFNHVHEHLGQTSIRPLKQNLLDHISKLKKDVAAEGLSQPQSSDIEVALGLQGESHINLKRQADEQQDEEIQKLRRELLICSEVQEELQNCSQGMRLELFRLGEGILKPTALGGVST